MIKIVDKKCLKCGKIYYDVVDSDVKKCNICGGELVRIYGMRKYKEYPAGYYENFEETDGQPVYIKDREHFWKEAKKRGIEPVGGDIAKKAKARKKKVFYLGGKNAKTSR